MTKSEILHNLSFYSDAHKNLRDEMENAATYGARSKGAILFVEGDGCETIGFVGKGNIRISKTGASGREKCRVAVNPLS